MNRLSLLFFLLISCVSFALRADPASIKQDHYKLYCMYTPQFKTMYEEYFLPSVQDDFEIIVKGYPQECPSGKFYSEGWDLTMLRKLEMLREAIEENWNKVFFYSDIDIIFLKPILEVSLGHLGNNDFVVQQGWPRNGLCAGFFVMRGNAKTLELITTAHYLLKCKQYQDDQDAIQAVLDRFMQGKIDWEFLPAEQFPNGRKVLKNPRGLYSITSEIILNDSMVLFHANCCIGLENKYDFLKQVQKEYLRMRSQKVIEE